MKHKIYYNKYKLLVDLPTGQSRGDIVKNYVNGNYESKNPTTEIRYAFYKNKDSIYLDYNGLTFSMSEVQNEKFFEPIGKPNEYIKPFPSKSKIKEFYYLIGENRLVDDVDEVRLINPIFYSEEFYDAVYELLRKMYVKKYKLKS